MVDLSQASLLLQAGKAFLNTQVMGSLFELRSGEVEDPSSQHAHFGDTLGNSWVLLHDSSNFQLFYAQRPGLTFIYSDNNTASYWADGQQTIYDFGHNNTLRFGEETGRVDIYGLDHDVTGRVKVFNSTDTSVQSDGNGGTLIAGKIDVHNAVLDASRVSFATTNLNFYGLVPLNA